MSATPAMMHGQHTPPARLALLGTGTVGSAVWARLMQWQGSALGERLRLVYAANSRFALGNPAGLPSAATDVLLQQAPQASSLEAVDVALAGDGVHSALLSPAQQGFGQYDGTIRILAQVAVQGRQGVAHFDVVYAPAVPATWLGVREAVEGGSLHFYLKAQVRTAGRYVVSGRVDDAQGKPFALVQFNQELGSGEQEMRLQVFGALIRDKAPAFPLRLRDVEGFLLIPDRFPDRALMPRWAGLVLQSGSYPLARFSSDEWSSEERDRYLAEYALTF